MAMQWIVRYYMEAYSHEFTPTRLGHYRIETQSVPNMLVGVYDQTRVDKPMAAKSASTHRILAMPGVLHASWRRGGGCKSVIPTMIKAMCKNHDVVLVLSV